MKLLRLFMMQNQIIRHDNVTLEGMEMFIFHQLAGRQLQSVCLWVYGAFQAFDPLSLVLLSLLLLLPLTLSQQVGFQMYFQNRVCILFQHTCSDGTVILLSLSQLTQKTKRRIFLTVFRFLSVMMSCIKCRQVKSNVFGYL